MNLPASGAICNLSPRFDGNLYRFIGAKRVSAAQYFVALAFLSSPPASPYGKGRCRAERDGGDKSKSAKSASLVIIFCRYEMRSSFGRDSSDGYCVAFAQSLGHVLIAYTPVGLYAGSLSRPRLTPETSVVPAYSKFGDRNFAPSGQRGRRDIAEQRSARTRLSLR